MSTTPERAAVYLLNGFLNRDSLSTIGVPSEETKPRMNLARAFVQGTHNVKSFLTMPGSRRKCYFNSG